MVESDQRTTAVSGRAHETQVALDAPIEEVWKALTEAGAISRWFAPKMTVTPGAGGFMLADWGPGLEWKTAIEIWEPNRHLRLVETRDRVMGSSPVEETLEPCRLVQDYYLESPGGRTVLRLVHSGFGSSEAWDREYEGTRGGWAACFLRLRHALELHRNDSVHNFIVTAPCQGIDSGQALTRIEPAVPTPFKVLLRGKFEFAGLFPELNGSILNVSVQPCPIGSMAYLELLLFGLDDAKAVAIEDQWRHTLGEMFPAADQTGMRN
jgi:uncharacterized protein YndB with AHSA1/START domain